MPAKKREIKIPAWLFVVLVLLLDELVFQLWTGAALPFHRLLTMALLTAAFGLLFALLASFGSDRICRVAAIVLPVLFAVVYYAEYLMHDAYQGNGGYMSLSIIFGTAAAAGNDFGETIFSVVVREIWRFLLLLVPIILYAVFGAKKHWGKCGGWKVRGLVALGCVICYALGVLCATSFADAEKYDKKFDFVEAVNTFGLLTALRLDVTHEERELEFSIETPPPTETIRPAETAPAEIEATESAEATEEPEEPPEEAPTEPVKPYNALDIDFAALAQSEPNTEIAKLHSYVASLQPSSTNAYTGLFAGKNLIFITAESFSREVIDPELTPTLYRMATKGIRFEDYYQPAWGGSTSTGEYSNMVGLVPPSENAMANTVGKNMYFTLGNRLQAEGYTAYGYHNNSYDYYHRDRTHENLGVGSWMGMGNGMEQGVEYTWPESDLQMIDYTMDFYMDTQPFYVYYITVTGHGPYTRNHYYGVKNYDAVAALDYADRIKYYLAANLELEYAMEHLLARLEQEGILNDTVIVLAADHYPYCLEKSTTWYNDVDYLSELYGFDVTDCFTRDHNGLILWSGCLEEETPVVVDTPVYSLDLVPTLLNLFGVDFDSRLLVGRDVFSDAEPIILWNTYSWKTDKGSYDYLTRRFTPADGVAEVDEAYIERINGIVANKISFSRGVLKYDYYNQIFPQTD